MDKITETKRRQYNKICKYLETVFNNCGDGYEVYKLVDYDPTMPEDVKEILSSSENAMNFAEHKFQCMRLNRELKKLQREIDKKKKELDKAEDRFLYSNIDSPYFEE